MHEQRLEVSPSQCSLPSRLSTLGPRSRLEYSLPDGIKDKWGHIVVEGETNNAAKAPQDPNQQAPDNILQINNERFVVAEALFHPGDLGLDQAGIAEACLQAVSDCEPALRPLLFSNILLIGMSSSFFIARMQLPSPKDRLVDSLVDSR